MPDYMNNNWEKRTMNGWVIRSVGHSVNSKRWPPFSIISLQITHSPQIYFSSFINATNANPICLCVFFPNFFFWLCSANTQPHLRLRPMCWMALKNPQTHFDSKIKQQQKTIEKKTHLFNQNKHMCLLKSIQICFVWQNRPHICVKLNCNRKRN